MAEKMPAEDVAGNVTRESLIAISYTLPEKVAATPMESLIAMSYTLPDEVAASPEASENNTDAATTVTEKDSSAVDDLISELISISYTSPDAEQPLPELKA